MPIYTHEVAGGLRRGVAAIPVFGSAATNTLVLGGTIILVVVAICFVFGGGDTTAARVRAIVRCCVYSLPPVVLLLYVYAGSVAAGVEGAAAGDVMRFLDEPVPEVAPRRTGAGEEPIAPRPDAAPLPAASSVSRDLQRIEQRLRAGP